MRSAEDAFIEFAELSGPRLRRTAFLLCGDWHTAEDLAQTALAKVFVAWRRINHEDAAHVYATRTLVNTYLADRRRRRPVELITDRLPERPVEQYPSESRIVVLDALATLPPRARAVIVLRYWSDQSVDQVAALLGCSAGNVKSQTARALDKLRAVLGDGGAEGAGANPPATGRKARTAANG
jgi:RNA polymerase sigma-70 factor (sigma-E family)